MINKLIISDINDLPIKYWKEVPGLQNKNEIEFSPGLNIIVGPNGSGKSTLLNLIRKTFLCENSYYSCYTKDSINNLCKNINIFEKNNSDYGYHGYDFVHDGNPVFCFDASTSIGIENGAFTDFMVDGINNMFSKKGSSSGQNIIYELNTMFQYSLKVNEIQDNIGITSVNDTWKNKIKTAQRIIGNPGINKSKITILLDEPTVNLDFIVEMYLWEMLEKHSEKYQIIIATHSIGLLKRFKCDVKIIEMKDGYIDKMKKSLRKIF